MRFALAPIVALAVAGPELASAQSLAEALTAAYERNPTILAARAGARAADESIVQARSGYLPDAQFVSEYTTRDARVQVAQAGAGILTAGDLSNSTVGVQLSQEVFTGLRRRGQVQSARASADAAVETLRETEQGVLLEAVAAFVDVRRDAEVVRIQLNNVEVLAQQRLAARDRFEVGETTRTDVAQAEARLASAQAGYAGAIATLEATRARFAAVVGFAPGALEPPPPAPALPETLDEALNQARAQSPAIAREAAAEEAARAQVRVERAALLPQLGLTGTVQRQEEFPFRRTESDSASATARLSVPLFEGGLNWSRVRQARIQAQRAGEVKEQETRDVEAAVVAAFNDHLAAQRVIDASREQERAAALAFEGAQEELSVGLRTTLDVLDAQQEFFAAQLAVVSAERDAYVAAHRLLAVTGGLTPGALGLNAELYDPAEHRRAVQWKVVGAKPVE